MQSFGSRSSLLVNDVRASQRRSFTSRISHRVALRLSFAGPPVEARSGTLTGTIINTLCSVIGAGVLSLPLALYFSSIVVGLTILLVLSAFAAFSVYCLVVGCDATGRYSLTEVVAFCLYPPQLWEEYISTQKASVDVASLQEASCSGRQQHSDGAATRTAVGQHRVQEEGRASDKKRGRGASQHIGDHGRHRHNPQEHACTDDCSAASFVVSPTSADAALRDEYARNEWRRRRCRRVVAMLMELVIFCSNYGALVVYSRVIADSMPPVVAYVTQTDGVLVSKHFWLVAGGIVFFILSCARNMEELKWTSLLGFLTIFYLVVLITFRYYTQQYYDYPHVDPRSHGELHWFVLSFGVLRAISAFSLAFSYHYNVPYFYKELQDRRPQSMMRSLLVAFPIIIGCYALTGIFGYWTFGDEVAARKVGGNIISNYPKTDLLMNIGRLGLFAHFACVFPVVSICTRRGLHRLSMIALTWSDQSALMMEAARASGAELTEAEMRGYMSTATGPSSAPALDSMNGGGHGDGVPPGENAPLLPRRASSTPGYEGFGRSYPFHHADFPPDNDAESASFASTNFNAGAGLCGNSCQHPTHSEPARISQPDPEQPGTIDVDRDVGSPDQTTTLAIVIEAAILVCTTVMMAAVVPGIDFVIHLIGTLTSVFVVMVAPGMVGWCVFSPRGPFGSASAAAAAYEGEEGNSLDAAVSGACSRFRLIRLKRLMCLVSAGLGISLTCIGTTMIVYDTLWRVPLPVG